MGAVAMIRSEIAAGFIKTEVAGKSRSGHSGGGFSHDLVVVQFRRCDHHIVVSRVGDDQVYRDTISSLVYFARVGFLGSGMGLPVPAMNTNGSTESVDRYVRKQAL